MKLFFACVISFLAILGTANAQRLQIKRIDSLMEVANNRGVFSGTILIAQKGKIIYHKAWGFADASQTRPLTTDMLFDIGSIAKEFNGVSIMLLKEQGKLNLENPVSSYLAGLPQWADHVKIKHLINYTSGLPNFTPQSNETDMQLLDSLRNLKSLKFEPGSIPIPTRMCIYKGGL